MESRFKRKALLKKILRASTTQTKTILVICREIPPVGGGAGRVAYSLAKHLCRNGWRVDIITMHYRGLPRVERQGDVTVFRLPCWRRHQDSSDLASMSLFMLQGSTHIKALFRKNTYDLIHAHAIIPDGLLAKDASGKSGTHFVITAHGSDVPGYNPDKYGFTHRLVARHWRKTLKQTAALVTPSNHLADLIHKKHAGYPVTVIPNGIDVKSLRPQKKNRDFLIVSRLVRRKNYHLFLKGLAGVREPQRVHFVGEGPMLDHLKALAKTMPQHDIRFHGWLPNGSDLWKELYETSRFFVFPSSSENFPINLLEALLAGSIVLASDIEGNREVLGQEAVYFPELTPAGIRQTLGEVLGANDSKNDILSNRARQRALSNFSWETIASSYNRLFEKIGG